jgi:hypothetical protein
MIDIDTLKEPFNKNTALRLLDEGYCIRHINWRYDTYVYKDPNDGGIYDQDEDCLGFIALDKNRTEEFELFREEEECQKPEINETTEEFGSKEDGEQKNKLSEKSNMSEIEPKIPQEENPLMPQKGSTTGKIENQSLNGKENIEEKILIESENQRIRKKKRR